MRLFNLILLPLIIIKLNAQPPVVLGPNSFAYDNISKGKVTKYSWQSKIYENTIRDYYVYVPHQYDASVAAALMVFQDGHTYVKEDGDFRVPTVFDNLIAQEKMPITIGLFVNPGHDMDKPLPESPWRSSNRSVEYDDLSDTYVRMLLEELIPELSKQYNISQDPKMHAICGISSGGICAFTAAWERSDYFQKVLSHIGSFTNIRGGHRYPALIRQHDTKTIKVFLQDGENDLDNRFGNWWLANQQMAAALEFKDYEFSVSWDAGAHNGKEGGKVLPEALTWLWSDMIPDRVASKLYLPKMASQNDTVLAGQTTHLREVAITAWNLKKGQSQTFEHGVFEQVFILQKGKCDISLKNTNDLITPGSVIVLFPGDSLDMQANDEAAHFYQMTYQSRESGVLNAAKNESWIVHFDSLPVQPRDKGAARNYFRTSTPMNEYFEMHMTTLNPGIKSHPPHTHRAEELIFMFEGHTEEEIGNQKFQASNVGIYYMGAHVPHSIKNIGANPCRYIAFQWY